MELPSLDLNLVVVLHALLQERNVTRAGERVGLSQPGTSAALARLRRHFGDPLLERKGAHYELTPLARSLHDQVGDTVEQLQRLLLARSAFDPTTASRRFVVACSDAVLSVLGPGVVRAVARAAPAVSLDFRALDDAMAADPVAVLRECDVLVAPHGVISGVPHQDLYRDRWMCAAWRSNTAVTAGLTREQVVNARWVMPFDAPVIASPADAALTALGIERSCAVRVESFAVLGRLVVGTDLLALVHRRLANQLPTAEIRELALPVDLPEITEAAWWHPSRELDPGHQWLRQVLAVEGEALDHEARSEPAGALCPRSGGIG